jgi:hypothetical protein
MPFQASHIKHVLNAIGNDGVQSGVESRASDKSYFGGLGLP